MGTIIFILLIVVVFAVFSYNSLQKLAQEVREKASNVQVAISKKLSVINQLIDVVKNYQEGEQLVQLKISEDNTAASLMNAYQQSGNTLSSIQGMAERFPNLKASEQYHRLTDSIQHCEMDIQAKRENYNGAVKDYNKKRLGIPTIFVARAMGFSEAPYLQFDTSGLADVTSLKEFKTDDGERLQQLLSKAGSQIAGASKTIANQAGQAGKVLADKIKEKSATKYFYMSPGGVPKGPVSLDEINNLRGQGSISDDAMVSVAGSESWNPVLSLTKQIESPNTNI